MSHGAPGGHEAPGGHGRSALAGRARELELLDRRVARVASGDPGVVLLTGAAGVGKTRLAREALAGAQSAGFRALAGHAHVLARDLAYAPVLQALGPLLRSLNPAERSALTAGLPQLSDLLGGPARAAGALPGHGLEATQLVDGLTRLAERLARQRPLALFIDDLHEADAGTAALLQYMVSGIENCPLLLLVTYRESDIDPVRIAALAKGVATSGWWLERLAVPPLPDDEAAALVSRLLGAPLSADLAAAVVSRCAGIPYFLEAMAASLAETGRLADRGGVLVLAGDGLPLPAGIREQLAARLSVLAEPERLLLTVLAVADSELGHDVLLAAAGLTEPEALPALTRLRRRELVAWAESGDGYGLAHELLRDALLAEQPAARVRALHAELAQTLARFDGDDPRIAEHVLRSGPLTDPGRALAELARAGARARYLGATDAALRCLEGAVALARKLDRGDMLAGLLAELGGALRLAGHNDRARAAWLDAVTEYTHQGDLRHLARMHRELALSCWDDGDLGAAEEHAVAAQETLRRVEPGREHAALLHALVTMRRRVGDAAGVADAAGRLRALAGQLRDPALSVRAGLAQALVDFAATDFARMTGRCEAALAEALACDDPVLVQQAREYLSIAAGAQGDMAGLREHSEAGMADARRLGSPALEAWARVRAAAADLLRGDLDAALRGTSEAVARARQLAATRGLVSGLALHAWVLVHLGRLDDAQRCLDESHALAPPALRADTNIFSMVAFADATLALARGEPNAASTLAAGLADCRTGWLPLLQAAAAGEAQAGCGDLDAARQTAARLRGIRSCGTLLPLALAEWVDGLADSAESSGPQSSESPQSSGSPESLGAREDRRREACRRLASSADMLGQLGLPFLAARARLALAEAAARPGSTPGQGGTAGAEGTAGPAGAPGDAGAAAVAAGRAALAAFEELGTPIQAQRARRVLRRLGVAASRGRPRAAARGALSPRELEVARLVATGLSNAEVATRLFISPRTVTTHLDRIYSRLQLSSRVALTRYLADSGLLSGSAPPASS